MAAITFTLIQTYLHWEDKEKNLQLLEEKIANIAVPTQVVVLPEMFSTGFSMQPKLFAENMNGPTVQWMQQIAQTKKILLTGSIIIEEEKKYYNRLLWVLPSGAVYAYNKRHLFAFAGEHQHYTAGTERLITSVNGWRINTQVCYDLRFPVWARQAVHPSTLSHREGEQPPTTPEYDILLYVANWPERRSTAWKTLLQARAIENQCYVIGVNRVGKDGNGIAHAGHSSVISPLGEVLYQKESDEDIFTITLHKKDLDEVRTKFPFLSDRDDFEILL